MSNKKKISTARFLNAKITSTISITLVLVLLGMTIVILFMGNGLSKYVKENMSFNVMLSPDVTDAQITNLRKTLDAQPFVKSSRFISRQEAKEQLIRDLGEDPEELLGYNPAQDCIEIFLHSEYANNDSIAVINKVVRLDNNVTDLLYQQEAIDLINGCPVVHILHADTQHHPSERLLEAVPHSHDEAGRCHRQLYQEAVRG